jgi:hypothetical protein
MPGSAPPFPGLGRFWSLIWPLRKEAATLWATGSFLNAAWGALYPGTRSRKRRDGIGGSFRFIGRASRNLCVMSPSIFLDKVISATQEKKHFPCLDPLPAAELRDEDSFPKKRLRARGGVLVGIATKTRRCKKETACHGRTS